MGHTGSHRIMTAIVFLALAASLWGCVIEENPLEENAVVREFTITPAEAREGCAKTVRAPDGKYYQLQIPAGIKDKTPLKLPPKQAARYDYPLYFQVIIRETDPSQKHENGAKP